MKRLLIILILTCSIPSWTGATDIREFEIEGISIGDSALDYFSKKEIDKANTISYDDDKFFDKEIYNHSSFSNYDGLQMSFKKNDNQFIIHALTGFNFYRKDVSECFKKVDEVSKSISKLLENVKKNSVNKSHEGDPTGKSKVKSVDYWHKSGLISVECWNWSDEITIEKGWTDNFGVSLFTNEHVDWLNNKAYN